MSKINRGQMHAATSVSLLSLWYCPRSNPFFQRCHIFCNIFTVNIFYLIRLSVWLVMVFNIAQEKNLIPYTNQRNITFFLGRTVYKAIWPRISRRDIFVLAALKCMKNRLCSFRKGMFWHLLTYAQRETFDFRMALKQFKYSKQISVSIAIYLKCSFPPKFPSIMLL